MWKAITVNTIYQIIGKGFGVTASIIVIALITRSLGAGGFGDYVLATTVPAFFYLFVDFGLNAIFLRNIVQGKDHRGQFGSLLGLRLGLAGLFFSLGALYIFLSPYPQLVKVGSFLGLFTVFTQGIFTSLNALFQHNLRYDLSILAGIFSSLLGVLLTIFGFLRGAGLLFFVGVWVLDAFVLAILAFLFSQKLPEKPSLSLNRVWLRRLFWASFPLGLMLIFAQINAKADIFLLSLLDTPKSLGIYGLADKVFDNALFIPTFFVNALYPVLLKDRKRSLTLLWSRLRKGVLLLLGVSLPLAVLGFVFSPLIVLILGGKGFESSILVSQLLVLTLPLFFVTAPLQWFLIVVGKERILPVIYGVAALVNITINILFIPRFSYLASVFATIFSELIILLLIIFAVRRFKSRMGKMLANSPARN
ncbi:MAG: hypothetical protein BMS9Abin34_503 [Patescibacteria group bacterium]|nr:MAG: hypothetical protein BMS9Abin34_503 [Patescibacteria group bacterium]